MALTDTGQTRTVAWAPHAGPQTDFLQCPFFEVFYGGAVGGGKSDCLLADALGQVAIPSYRGLLLRRSYPELKELIGRSKLLYPKIYPGAKWRGDEKTWTFPSGATIEFGYCQYDDDKLRYQGQQYQWVGFDELTHFTEDMYLFILSRIRAPEGATGLTCYVRSTGNPGGRGHAWVKARFIDASPANVPLYDAATDTVRIFIPSKLTDNPSLNNTDYGRRLLMLSAADQKALIGGDWSAYEGSVFTFEKGIHIWSWEKFEEQTGHARIPDHWKRWRTMDYGFAKPFAVYWYATDEENRAYVYREWYGVAKDGNGKFRPDVGCRMEPSRIGEKIASIEADADEHMQMAWTGPDLNSAGRGDTSGGIKIIEHFMKQGIFWSFWSAGHGSRKAKKTAFEERLRYLKDPETGEITQYPGLIFIESECPHALRTIPSLEYDPAKGGEDINDDAEDHCYDSITAFCLMRPWASASATKKPTRRDDNPWTRNL